MMKGVAEKGQAILKQGEQQHSAGGRQIEPMYTRAERKVESPDL